MRSDLTIGSSFPDYELPDHTDKLRRLSFLQGDDPMVLTLHRGVYCPKDRQQLHELVHFSKLCAVGFVRLLSISTDSLMMSNALRSGVGADWTFLHDSEGKIKQDLEIEEYTDPDPTPMIPHTFVLEPGLKIYKIYNGYWYWGRPTLAELHLDLRDITSRIRSDYQIDTPQMRSKWESGNKADFSPYGKSPEQTLIRMVNAIDRVE
jgi:peroxiredoxin